jgi:hypothetical protein
LPEKAFITLGVVPRTLKEGAFAKISSREFKVVLFSSITSEENRESESIF